MHSMISLLEAITFIENNLKGELSVADVATSAYVSVPHLQRMFANVFQCSVGDYATKRKLCAAAQDLLATPSPSPMWLLSMVTAAQKRFPAPSSGNSSKPLRLFANRTGSLTCIRGLYLIPIRSMEETV